jgi:hypothetical protein
MRGTTLFAGGEFATHPGARRPTVNRSGSNRLLSFIFISPARGLFFNLIHQPRQFIESGDAALAARLQQRRYPL